MTAEITPHSLKDAPSLIERLWPSIQISVEAEQERGAKQSQTLTPLGAYWKGRKPLILVRAAILASLLPATDDPEKDLAIFEAILGIDARAFGYRAERISAPVLAELSLNGSFTSEDFEKVFVNRLVSEPDEEAWNQAIKSRKVSWRRDITGEVRRDFISRVLVTLPYQQRVGLSSRIEHLGVEAFTEIWDEVNRHLGTKAASLIELVHQLGQMRFGEVPHVVDTFAGGGSIPFEAARIGCAATASDLNPIACMLSWGSGHIIGATDTEEKRWKQEHAKTLDRVAKAIDDLGFEFDEQGNKAKAFLYCLEARCIETGWFVPLLPTRIISKAQGVVARLVPVPDEKRYDIVIDTNVSADTLKDAEIGTVQGDYLVHEVAGESFRTSLKSLRGGGRLSDGSPASKLRTWEKTDVAPRPDDVFQERLYAILWMSRETIDDARPKTFFTGASGEDLRREEEIRSIVEQNIVEWQNRGLIPDMEIEQGENNSQPVRERGWTYWHHLFTPRQLHFFATFSENNNSPVGTVALARVLDRSSKLNRWSNNNGSTGQPTNVFSNQALNTMLNYGSYASRDYLRLMEFSAGHLELPTKPSVVNQPANQLSLSHHLGVTDPPYADAINYHEITEFFISWLRRNPPAPFNQWLWDSRRPLAIKGEGDGFRREMVLAYKSLADNMADNGLQIVMFTHQSGAVWADLAQIFWGAGLQVSAAWYIATETSSELKKGGYVQGTVILVLRKRVGDEGGYEDEIAHEVRAEVARQIDTLVGLNQSLKGEGRMENLFEDSDLQMAGYAAALRVLTGYTKIDGRDMTAEATRPRQRGEKGFVERIIDFAVQVANDHMVPEGLSARLWQQLTGTERFYLKMLGLESAGLKKLDNYQNFARAFRVPDYSVLMADNRANSARLKRADDLKHRTGFDITDFGSGVIRAVLYGAYQLSKEVDADVVIEQLHEMVENYFRRRDELIEVAEYLAVQRGRNDDKEGRHAATLAQLIRNERIA